MTCFGTGDDMDLDKPNISDDCKGSASSACSICLEVVLDRGERSVAKLQCGHEFHLDCIGSAFNAKGAMQCPNCRKVEKGHWLYAHGHRSSTDFDLDGWITEDIYDLNYAELPLGYQWCPFSVTQLASLFDDMESPPNSYHEILSGNAYGDRSGSSGSNHVCPYLALHGYPHSMHTTHSSSSDHVPENSHFRRHSTSLGGPPAAEMRNPHNFSSAEPPPNHTWQPPPPQLSLPLPANSDHQYGLRLPRADSSNNQQRLGSFVHSHPLPHGSVHPRSGSNLVAGSMAAPPILGESRAHSNRSSAFSPIRRTRPRGLTLVSTSASTDTSGFYGFPSSTSRGLQDSGRQFDRAYGWGRDNFTAVPWIPVDGDSWWWAPFNPSQAPSSSFHQRGGATNERVAQNHRSENGYHQRPPPSSRMPPPPPYM